MNILQQVRSTAAWADRTGWSWIELGGSDRLDLLNRLSTNEVANLPAGTGRQTVLLTEKARIIDVLTLCNDTDRTMVLASPSQASRIVSWLRTYTITDDVRAKDRTDGTAMIEILGPRAAAAVHDLSGTDVSTISIAEWKAASIDGKAVTIVRMPSASELSYWIVATRDDMSSIIELLRANAATFVELDPATDEYIRVLGGQGRLGHEWSDAYNPLEAGLLHLTSFTKGCYIGQEVVARLDSYNKVKQRIMGLHSQAALAEGDEVMADGAVIGRVTSVVPSCDGHARFALAYVRGEHAHPDTTLAIRGASGDVTAVQSLLPMQDPSCPS